LEFLRKFVPEDMNKKEDAHFATHFASAMSASISLRARTAFGTIKIAHGGTDLNHINGKGFIQFIRFCNNLY